VWVTGKIQPPLPFLKSEGFLSLVQKLGQQPEVQIYDVAAYID